MKPTTRLLHLIHHDDQGGAPLAVVHHLRYFAGSNAATRCENYAVFGSGPDGKIEEYCKAGGVPYSTPWLGRKMLLPLALLQTWWIIRRWKPDLVLVYGQWGAPVGALAARMAGVRRCIYNSQWPAYYQDFTPLKAALNSLAESVPAALCRRIIALSPGNFHQYFIRGWDEAKPVRPVSDAAAAPPPGKLVLLPNCTDTVAPSQDSIQAWRAQWGWRADIVHVVSLGRLVPQKRMDWLMRAWALMQNQARSSSAPASAHLWIVGGGDIHQYRELARQLGISNTCTITGFEREGWKRVAAADVFALASRSEGLPFVVLEAMASGVPVVASRVDGIEGTVRDGQDGILAGPTDLPAFAGALNRIIRDSALRKRLSEGARERSRDYKWSKIMPKYEALYDEVLAEE